MCARSRGAEHEEVAKPIPFRAGRGWARALVGPTIALSSRLPGGSLMPEQARFQAMVDALPQLVWATDETGRHTYFNRGWYEFTGFSEEESMDFGFVDALHPEDRDRTLERWERAWRDGEPYEIEYRFYSRPRGEYRWFLGRATPVQDDSGAIVQWMGTCTDIEPQKRAQEQVRRRTAQLEASWGHQTAVSELGLLALRSRDVDELMRVVVRRTCSVLGADLCKVLEMQPDRERLLLKAATGWDESLIGRATVPSHRGSQAGYTLLSQEPVIVRDLRRETRFEGSALLHDYGAVSGMSVVIYGTDGPYGVLTVHTKQERAFGGQEVHFIQAVANLLGEAIWRIAHEDEAARLGQRLTDTLESITDAFFTLDTDWRFTYLNARAETVLRRSREELLGESIWKRFPEAEKTIFAREYRRAVREGVPVRFEAYFEPLDAWFDVSAYPSEGGLTVYFQDVSERKAVEARMELYRTFHSTLAGVIQESLRGELDDTFYQRVVDAAVRLVPGAQAGTLMLLEPTGEWSYAAVAGFDRRLLELRLPAEQMDLGPNPQEPTIVSGFDPEPLDEPVREVLFGPIGRAGDIRATLLVPVWLGSELRAYLHLDNFESRDGFSADAVELGRLFARQIGSVMQRMDLERDLVHQARTDIVTGIPNRRYAEDFLQQCLDEGCAGALLFLDLDEFKHVNEAYGHPIGDELLRHAAARILDVLEEEDVLARWGGDEFLAMIPNVTEPREAIAVARDLQDTLRVPFRIQDAAVVTSASVGVLLFDDTTRSVHRAVLEADIALGNAKRRGKDQVVLFTSEMGAQASRRFMIEEGLRAALQADDEELCVRYQPRVNLRTGRIEAVEALSRWTHPSLGTISPTEFVPVAEAARLIHGLTRRVLDHACRQARVWHDAGTPRMVSVNLSAENVRHVGIVEDVREALERHQLPADLLELEVTEGAAMTGVEDSVARLRQLRDLGTSIAIDDFGTAYSSLSYLKMLPVDTLKIDKSFLVEVPGEDRNAVADASLLRGIVALGRSLGLFVVAEGVETEAQARFLMSLGCHGGQGNYFGSAVPPGEIRDRTVRN